MTYLGIEVNETALLILLAIIAVSLIFIGWKLARPAAPSPPGKREKRKTYPCPAGHGSA